MPQIDQHAFGTVCWYSLETTDPAAARDFYAKLFGWTYQLGGAELNNYATCLAEGQRAAGLGGKPPGDTSPSAWTVFFAVESVDQTLVKVRGAGGSVLIAGMDVPSAGRMAVCTDSTGATLGIWQAREHGGAAVRGEPGSMAWQEVNTRDARKARTFFEQVFGLTTRPLGAMENYYTMHLGELTVAGMMQMGEEFPPSLPAHWMPYFAVANCDSAAEQAADLGGKICVKPFDTPYGRIAVLEDPAGVWFSVLQLSDSVK